MTRLPSRTSTTTDDMPLAELLQSLSATALPRSAMYGKWGEVLDEDQARAGVNDLFNNRRNVLKRPRPMPSAMQRLR